MSLRCERYLNAVGAKNAEISQRVILFFSAVFFAYLACAMQVLSKMEVGPPTTPFRWGCQTTRRCWSREGTVVNGSGKACLNRQVSDREMNESELLTK